MMNQAWRQSIASEPRDSIVHMVAYTPNTRCDGVQINTTGNVSWGCIQTHEGVEDSNDYCITYTIQYRSQRTRRIIFIIDITAV